MIKHSYCYENKVKCLKVNPWDQRGSLVAKTLILYVPDPIWVTLAKF